MDDFLDMFAGILLFLMVAAPVIAIVVWWRKKDRTFFPLLVYLVMSLFVSLLLYFISLEIIFRDGLGPG